MSREKLLKRAKDYASPMGLRVFPCRPKEKAPATAHGCKDATTDLEQIAKWWDCPYNIGIATGNGIVVLDVDINHDAGKYGDETLADLEGQYGPLPETWMCLTGGGGVHYYFQCDDPALTVGVEFAPGLDYRGNGGYVIAPPSVHQNGRTYEWEAGHTPTNCALAPLPDWLHRLMLQGKTKDKPTNSAAPEKVTEGKRNDEMFRLAASLRAKGLTVEEITAAMMEANKSRCDPPLSKQEIETICKSVGRYKQGTADMPPEKKSTFDSLNFYTIPSLTEEERRPPEFIVDGMIPCGLSFLSGAPKIRKTFLGLQLSFSVADGRPFLGRKTVKCDVAYLDLEGSKSRAASRAERMSTDIPENVFITNNIKERLADGLVDKLRELHRENPKIRMIVIDTYSRARGNFKAGSSNAYDAEIILLEPVQRMAIEEKIAILCIHHDKKGAGFALDSFERMSGTMGISGSADSVLNLIADGKRFDGKAILEYTPRDAKGGEMNLVFDDRLGEWQEVVNLPKEDIRGNPICDWIIRNVPEKRSAGMFLPYEDVFKYAYHCQIKNSGDEVRKQLESRRDELYSGYGIGIQMGVKSNGDRGIRIINLL
ncbi:bifunctional DNA primase/polymerase [Oscillibacter sp. MSJ-2]|uniref:Bifunctional DNA primase/polymerase n=1 Tax=Dysosmobacter acutus TaxID=2841504 RepID=A0ABS6F5Z4_9FIRM|nr:bifunctional DNA primase/polymerase [Dysosmobacter acutus]